MGRSNDLELAYLVIETEAPDAVGSVLSDVVGLMPGEDVDGARTWRNDDRAQRVVLQRGPAEDVIAAGLEVGDLAAAMVLVDRLSSLGYLVSEGTADSLRARRVEALWHTTAPWGVMIEIVVGAALASSPVNTPLVPSGFLTEGMGLGHCVFFVPDLVAAHRFVVEGLGFRQTDSLGFDVGPDVAVSGRFYHCNPRHHTMALIQPPLLPPFTLHHIMVEVNDQDDVGRAFDRAYAAGLPIANGIGRHPNDRVISFYVETPARFQVEVGFGGRLVGPDWDEDIRYDRISEWGHQPVLRP